MKLPDDDFDDSNIYATDVVMLKVREKGASNRVIHDVVKANYSVRPLEFCKESEEKIQSDNQILMVQITILNLLLSMLMGEIWKTLCESVQQCGMVKVILQ